MGWILDFSVRARPSLVRKRLDLYTPVYRLFDYSKSILKFLNDSRFTTDRSVTLPGPRVSLPKYGRTVKMRCLEWTVNNPFGSSYDFFGDRYHDRVSSLIAGDYFEVGPGKRSREDTYFRN